MPGEGEVRTSGCRKHDLGRRTNGRSTDLSCPSCLSTRAARRSRRPPPPGRDRALGRSPPQNAPVPSRRAPSKTYAAAATWSREWAVGSAGLLEPLYLCGLNGFWTIPFAWSDLAGMGCCVLPDPRVAECGNHDTGLAPGKRLIPGETDQANGLPTIRSNRHSYRLEQRRDDQQPILTTSPVGPLTPPEPVAGFRRPSLPQRSQQRCGACSGRLLDWTFAVQAQSKAPKMAGRRDRLQVEVAKPIVGAGGRQGSSY